MKPFLFRCSTAALVALLLLVPFSGCHDSSETIEASSSAEVSFFGEAFSGDPVMEGEIRPAATPTPTASASPIVTAAPEGSPSGTQTAPAAPTPVVLPSPSPLPENTAGSDTSVDPSLEATPIEWTDTRTVLDEDFYQVTYSGDYGLDDMLAKGGVSSVSQLAAFVLARLGIDGGIAFDFSAFGCSTIEAPHSTGGYLFGRNFDWTDSCTALVLRTIPENGYRSISTVNMDFYLGSSNLFTEEAKILAAVYAPLDGMNEKGLCISVNMVGDADTISQDTGKPNLTTTSAIRLLLDRAADIDEAIVLLEQYDMHESLGTMVHFFLADATGRSVAVEYIDNELYVTETKVMTNFYMTPGPVYGIGTGSQRYELLMEALDQNPSMVSSQLRDALCSVSRQNFSDYETTEWSVVFDQTTLQAVYYHRGDYSRAWQLSLLDP